MKKVVIIYIFSLTIFLFLFDYNINAINERLPIEDISTSIVLTKENLYIVNSKNELLVCGVAGKYVDSPYSEQRDPDILQTSLKKVMDNVAAVSASGTSSHVFALKLDGSLWGWGFNNANSNIKKGMLGLGEEVKWVDTPIKIMDNVVSVSTSNEHTLALKNDGSLWSWGRPGVGASSVVPTKIMDNVIFATNGGPFSYDSLVIKEDNSLWVSGSYNVFPYNLSDGITIDANKPEGLTRVMENVKFVSSYYSSNFAVKLDGSLWSWGIDNTGELGNGGKYDQGPGGQSWSNPGVNEADRIYKLYTYQRSPLKILDHVERVIPTSLEMYSFTTDGQLWMWGDSAAAEAYIVNKKIDIIKPLDSEKTVPRKITADFSYISHYGNSSVILKKDGSVWVKGDNEYGQLGTGDTNKVDDYTKILSGGVTGQQEFKIFKAVPTASPILINGEKVSFGAYTINGYNYFKLRDLAMVINGTEKQFEVVWDSASNSINLITNKAYTVVGGELSPLASESAMNAIPSSSKVLVNNKVIQLTAYKIAGNNYFKLRDIAGIIDYGVSYDRKTGTITIDSSTEYTE
ncbi:MAG: hypothetical protein CVV02_02230 [Firmicutes bacterium HGW-Firmicutes-7]|nr:MAG: hypothetical protein CVV02_02230 [Firmicutes bacterium HGW-Firmicutes-7]